jgi:DNA-binding response OmpR family regulator
MALQKVLLDCRSLEDARILKSYIERELPYEPIVSFDPAETSSIIGNRPVHLLVLQTNQLREAEISRIRLIRESGYTYPILALADRVNEAAFATIAEKYKAYFLEKPYELKTFKGLVRKLMTAKAVPQQQHRRYHTRQAAMLETFISGESFQTEMFNLSMGGAYFELAKKPQVGVGDLLRLKIPMANAVREHSIHGRIVWTTHKGPATGGYGLGVKFIKSNDMYRQLIDKV